MTVPNLFKTVIDKAVREPVLGFGAIGLSITAWWPAFVDTDAKKAAVAGILLYLQRIFSVSKKSAEENIESAKYVGAVEHQALAQAGQLGATPPPPPIEAAVPPAADAEPIPPAP